MDSIGGSVKRLLLTSLAVSLLAITSCGVAKDDIAATINGHEITVAQIRKMSGAKELAQSSAQDPTAAPAQRGTIAGSVARGAVTLLVQRELLAKALSQLGGKVTPVDTSAAEQRTTQMSASIKSFATGYFALDAALLRVAKASLPAPTRADVTAYFDQHAADFRTTCIDVIGVQPSAVAAARAALDSGTPFGAPRHDAGGLPERRVRVRRGRRHAERLDPPVDRADGHRGRERDVDAGRRTDRVHQGDQPIGRYLAG